VYLPLVGVVSLIEREAIIEVVYFTVRGNRRLGYGLSYVAFAPSRRKRVRRVTECVARSKKHQHHTVFVLVINARCCATNAINELDYN
jgi:hypothetical protein